MEALRARIDRAWESKEADIAAVEQVMALLDRGEVRVAEKKGGEWVVNDWLKRAILLYFRQAEMREGSYGDYRYFDKIPLKTDLQAQGVRVVPPAVGV